MNVSATSAALFEQSIVAGLRYWQQYTSQLDDELLGILELERQNLHRAVQYGLALPDTWRDAVVLALQSFDFVERHGYWLEWIPLLKKALANCPAHEPHFNVKISTKLGQFYRLDQRLSEAIAIHQGALATAVNLQDKQLLAEVHFDLGEDYRVNREYTVAEQHASTALSIFATSSQMESWQAATLNTLGLIARARSNLSLSEKRLSQSVTIRRSLKQPLLLARSLNDLAITLQEARKFDQAKQCLDEALTLLTSSKNRLDEVRILNNLGTLHFKQQQWTEADATFRKALSVLATQAGYVYYRAVLHHNVGEVLFKQNKLEAAEEHLQHSNNYWQLLADTLMLANTRGLLGEVLAAQTRKMAAKDAYKEAIDLLQKKQNNVWAGQLLEKYKAHLRDLTVN